MIPIRDDNPTRMTPIVTVGLIGACVLVFLWQVSLGAGFQAVIYSLGFIPALFFTDARLEPDLVLVPTWFTVITSMFMHGGWMHLLGNMLYLWIFGDNVEDSMGHGRFMVFYGLCGIAAAFGQSIVNPSSAIPMVGASGAISGVLGAYMLLFPRARVLVLIPFGLLVPLVRLPALWVLGFWFVIQLVSAVLTGEQQGGVAFFAHASGFIAGMVLIRYFKYPHVPLYRKARGPR